MPDSWPVSQPHARPSASSENPTSPDFAATEGTEASENLQTTNAGEGVEKREPSCTVGGNVNWYSHYGEQYGGSLKN